MKIIASLLVFLCPLLLFSQEDEPQQGTILLRKRDTTPAPPPPPVRPPATPRPDRISSIIRGYEGLSGIGGIKDVFRHPNRIDRDRVAITWMQTAMISSFGDVTSGNSIIGQIGMRLGFSLVKFRDQGPLDVAVPLLLEIDQLRFGGFGLSLSGGVRFMEGTDERMRFNNMFRVLDKYVRGEVGVGFAYEPFLGKRGIPCTFWQSLARPRFTCTWRRIGPYQFRGFTVDFQFWDRRTQRMARGLRGSANDLRDGF